MDEDGVLVKAEEDGLVVVAAAAAAEGGSESVTVKAENNEHRVAELSLDEGNGIGGGIGGGEPAKVEPESPERAGPGPIDNGSLGKGRELREGMVSYIYMDATVLRKCWGVWTSGLYGFVSSFRLVLGTRPCVLSIHHTRSLLYSI